MTMLCVSLMPETTDQALGGLAEAASCADMAEIRLDAMREFDLVRLLTSPPCPVVVTYRPKRQGGLYDGPEGPRLQTLRSAAQLGARFIDVEHDAITSLGDVSPAKVIVSYHDFSGTPADLPAIGARLRRSGAAVVKLAVMANHILDTAAVLRLLRDAAGPTIAISMGPRGVLTRILAPKFGAFLTYAACGTGPQAGPGQVSLDDMRRMYRVHRITAATRVYGVIADPVGHSLSPRLHNAAFAETGLDAVYLPLWVEGDPAAFVRAMREFAIDGYSVTIPHKQAVMAALDDVEPVARRIGAVNTIVRHEDGRLAGMNTDWTAGLASIDAVVGQSWLSGKRALVLGSGGVGRAMAFGLSQRGAAITLSDVDLGRAESLAREVGAEWCAPADLAALRFDAILNCTPVGMHPKVDESPLPPSMLRPGMLIYDAVYNPLETRLLKEARQAGCLTVAGVDHFVRQAAEQFVLWTGRPAPIGTMRRVLVEALGQK